MYEYEHLLKRVTHLLQRLTKEGETILKDIFWDCLEYDMVDLPLNVERFCNGYQDTISDLRVFASSGDRVVLTVSLPGLQKNVLSTVYHKLAAHFLLPLCVFHEQHGTALAFGSMDSAGEFKVARLSQDGWNVSSIARYLCAWKIEFAKRVDITWNTVKSVKYQAEIFTLLDAHQAYITDCRACLKNWGIQEYDYAWRNDLGVGNALLNWRIALKKASAYHRWFGIDMDDLLQEANVGLVIAAGRYDPARNTRFVTYACYWIEQRIKRYLWSNSIMRVPVYISDLMSHTDGVLSDAQKDSVLRAWVARNVIVDSDIIEGLAARGEDARAPIPEISLDQLASSMDAVLSARQELVLRMRYGLNAKLEEMSLESIGAILGLTRERIRQIEREALGRLHGYFTKSWLKKQKIQGRRTTKKLAALLAEARGYDTMIEEQVQTEVEDDNNEDGCCLHSTEVTEQKSFSFMNNSGQDIGDLDVAARHS